MCVQVTLSGRDVDKGLSVRTSGVQITAIPSSEAEGSASHLQPVVVPPTADGSSVCSSDLNCLTLTFNEPLSKNRSGGVVSRDAPLLFLCCIIPLQLGLNVSGVEGSDQERPDPLHGEPHLQPDAGQRPSQDLQTRAEVRALSHKPAFSPPVK